MSVVGGFDVHRAQITYDYVDTDTGEISTGQIRSATRLVLRDWCAQRFAAQPDAAFAVEGCTGWRFVVEEMVRAGVEPHLAEPADAAAQRGRKKRAKKRAKTDRADARLQRKLLSSRRLPESWIPPAHVVEVRVLGRLYLTLMDERRAWQQRIHAQLFQQGLPTITGLLTARGRAALTLADLTPAGRQMVDTAVTTIDSLTGQIQSLRQQLTRLSRRHPGPLALQTQYGIGPLSAVIIWAELRDCRRFANSDQAVRFTGLDITVYSLRRETLSWEIGPARISATWPGSTPANPCRTRRPESMNRCASSPHSADACGWLPRCSTGHLLGGPPGKNEQPHHTAGYTPHAIMSPGSPSPEHPDKAGRHRAPISPLTAATTGDTMT